MIRYELQCSKGHHFDAWFRDSKLADRQLGQKKVECVTCGNRKVEKALMAPRLGRPHKAKPVEIASENNDAASHETEAKALLRGLRKYVEETCEDVGTNFAQEARKLHRKEGAEDAKKKRGIYGLASPKEQRSLYEEGIDIAILPWVPENDA